MNIAHRASFRAPRLLAAVVLTITASTSLAAIACAQEVAERQGLTVARMLSGEFAARGFPGTPAADGSGYVRAADGGLIIEPWQDAEPVVLATAAALTPQGQSAPLRVEAHELSNDGRWLLVFTNSRQVWRQNTRGDYWLLDRESGSLRKLGGDARESSLMFAELSPTGDAVAYVLEGDLYVESTRGDEIRRLTTGGSKDHIHGTSDWVYEEELSIRKGYFWSPDGRTLAFYRFDTTGMGEYPLVDHLAAVYPTVHSFRHPKPGTTNPAVDVGVISASGGEARFIELPGDPREHYIARVGWTPEGDALLIQRLNREQDRVDFWRVPRDTLNPRVVHTDRDDAWVDVEDVVWLQDTAFLTLSERDGWRHAYAVRDGVATLLTPGDYDVISIEHVDLKGGWIYLIASPDDPTRRALHRVPLNGGPLERVSPAADSEGGGGTNDYRFCLGADLAIWTRSSFGVPPRTSLITLPEHDLVRDLEDNKALRERLASLPEVGEEMLRVDVDGEAFDAWMIKPPDFDPDKRYPVLVYVYGEPAGQTVLDRWGGRTHLWHRLVAEQGYVVLSIDNRGTPAPRGRAWRKCVHRKVGVLATEEQAAALVALLARYPFLDGDRVGVWGWSGGGSMTLNLMFRHPDLYHAGMSIAFVADQRLYDTIYQERYMDTPETNVGGYRDGSPVTYAAGLQGDLLLIYGSGDDNTHYQNFEVLADELIAHDKRFEMMVYPGRRHGLGEGRGSQRHLYRTMLEFLLRTVPTG